MIYNQLNYKLILASSSPYRKALLERLNLTFDCHSPAIDETRLDNETATDYVRRLALEKAQAVSNRFPGAIVIGSDQCARIGERILGKPGCHENALRQLREAQGKTVVFHTGICVTRADDGFLEIDEVPFEVDFRRLNDRQLEHYLRVEEPYQCAGSFKSEGYGVALFSRMRGDDPTALIGLPLIRLASMLENAGIEVI